MSDLSHLVDKFSAPTHFDKLAIGTHGNDNADVRQFNDYQLIDAKAVIPDNMLEQGAPYIVFVYKVGNERYERQKTINEAYVAAQILNATAKMKKQEYYHNRNFYPSDIKDLEKIVEKLIEEIKKAVEARNAVGYKEAVSMAMAKGKKVASGLFVDKGAGADAGLTDHGAAAQIGEIPRGEKVSPVTHKERAKVATAKKAKKQTRTRGK